MTQRQLIHIKRESYLGKVIWFSSTSTMNTLNVLIFTTLFLLSQRVRPTIPTKEAVDVLSKMFKNVFKPEYKSICFIHEATISNHIAEESVKLLDTPMISLTLQHLPKMNLKGIDRSFCQNSLVFVEEADVFLELLFATEFNDSISALLSPWSRMIFAYGVPPKDTKDLLTRLVDEFFIDVFVLDFLAPQTFQSLSSYTGDYFIVKHLYTNRSVLILDTKGNLKARWDRFEPTKWIPRFPSGKPFRISLFHCPPFWFIENGTRIKGALDSSLVNTVVEEWQVEYFIDTVQDPDMDNWEYSQQLLAEKKRDVVLCFRWFVEKEFTYTRSVHSQKLSFLVKKPIVSETFTFVYRPFECSVYSVVFGTLIVISLLLSYFRKVSGSGRYHWLVHFMMMFSILNQVAVNSSLKLAPTSSRILVVSWMIFSFLTVTYYSAGMTSTLTHPRLQYDVTSLEDMVEHQIPWYDRTTYFQQFFESAENDTFMKLADQYTRKAFVADQLKPPAILVKIIGGHYVDTMGNLPSRWNKLYKVLSTDILQCYSFLVLQKHSPYKRYFDVVISRLTENGMVGHSLDDLLLDNRELLKGFFTNYVDDVVYSNIEMESLQGAFLLLAVGLGLATIAFLLELIVNKPSCHIIER